MLPPQQEGMPQNSIRLGPLDDSMWDSTLQVAEDVVASGPRRQDDSIRPGVRSGFEPHGSGPFVEHRVEQSPQPEL